MGVYILAEAGVNHNGDIELAKKLIDVAKEANVDAVKFQTFITEKIVGKFAEQAEYQKENTGKSESQYDMVKKLELSFEDFKELKRYCEEKGVVFTSTPDEVESLDFLVNLGVPFIKVGSTEVTNLKYLREIAKRNLPIVLSTGMSTIGEVESALNVIYEEGNKDVTLLHATTDYPTMAEDVNLRAMVTLRDAFKVDVGYSDHTLGNEAAIAATTLGATIIEKHFTLDKSMEGPDHKASMDPEELKNFVKAIRNTEKLLGNGRKAPTKREQDIMKAARRSIVVTRPVKAGTMISQDIVDFKRPGNGIKPEFENIVMGRILKRDLKEDEPIQWSDI